MNLIILIILLVLGYLFLLWIFSLFPPEVKKFLIEFVKP